MLTAAGLHAEPPLHASGRRRRPHTVIQPDTISPRTPTETLRQIVAATRSAGLCQHLVARAQQSDRPRLFQAVQRFTDGLHVAAEQLVGPQTVAELDQADRYVPGLTTEPAWPTLRAHLVALAAETGDTHSATC